MWDLALFGSECCLKLEQKFVEALNKNCSEHFFVAFFCAFIKKIVFFYLISLFIFDTLASIKCFQKKSSFYFKSREVSNNTLVAWFLLVLEGFMNPIRFINFYPNVLLVGQIGASKNFYEKSSLVHRVIEVWAIKVWVIIRIIEIVIKRFES